MTDELSGHTSLRWIVVGWAFWLAGMLAGLTWWRVASFALALGCIVNGLRIVKKEKS